MGQMVVKNLSTFNFKRLPIGFLLALLVILLFESLNLLFDDYFYKPPYVGLRVKIKNEILHNANNRFNFLILGDCYPLTGVIPDVIEAKTNLTGFNLATHVDYTILSSYCVLKNYLATCVKKPKYIIISFLPMSCSLTKEEIVSNDMRYFYDFSRNNELSFIKEFGFKQSVLFLIPSLKHQYLWKNILNEISTLKFLVRNSNKVVPFVNDVQAKRGYASCDEYKIFMETVEEEKNYKISVSASLPLLD